MDIKVVLRCVIGYLPYKMYELKRLENDDFMLRDIPLVINGKISVYEEKRGILFCYLYDKMPYVDQEILKDVCITLKDNKNGTYTMLDSEGVKIKNLKLDW